MARDKKKTSGRTAPARKKAVARGHDASARNGQAPKLDKKIGRVIEKRIKKLRSELTEAARTERKRLRALERARNRRQLIEAALDELRPEKTIGGVPAESPAASQPAVEADPPA